MPIKSKKDFINILLLIIWLVWNSSFWATTSCLLKILNLLKINPNAGKIMAYNPIICTEKEQAAATVDQ